MMADKEATVRQNTDTKRTAIKTGLRDKARAYFVFDSRNGGWYTDGEREGVAEWPELTA